MSQIFGGGGGASGTFRSDYIELENNESVARSLNGMSLQYSSAAGTSWIVAALPDVVVQPGQYFLVVVSTGTGQADISPAPDFTTSTSLTMSATAAKVALVNSTVPLSGSAPSSASIVDFVGYGSTASAFEGSGPALGANSTTALFRRGVAPTDTSDNSADFVTGTPAPRNSATVNGPIDAVPEPSTTVLLLGATVGSLLQRRVRPNR